MVEKTTDQVLDDINSQASTQLSTCDGYVKVRQLGTGTSGVVELMEKVNDETGKTEQFAMKKLRLSNDDKERKRQLMRIKYEFDLLKKMNDN